MKGKVFNIIVIVVISLLSVFTVYQGIVIDNITEELWWTRSELLATKADLDELGAIAFAMGAGDMELMLNLDARCGTEDMIIRNWMASNEALLRGDYETYNELQNSRYELWEFMDELRAQWHGLVTYKYNWLNIMEDKWEPK